MDEIGPVDYLIVSFPGNQFKGDIAPALADLVDAGTIRIIDLVFVGKDENGDVVTAELLELDPAVQAGLERLGVEPSGLLSDEDLTDAAEALEPNSSAALLLWENIWAKDVANAIRAAGGQLVDFGRLPHDAVQAAREAIASA